MFLHKQKRINLQKGAVMLLTSLLFMSFALVISFGLANPIIKQSKISVNLWGSKESYYLSESGMEDVLYRVKNNMTVGTNETLVMNDYSTVTGIVPVLGGKVLTSISNSKGYIKKIETKIKKGAGVSFFYGILAGEGGLSFSGGSKVLGNVYSNGPITGSSTCYITGSAVSANSASLSLDQVNSGAVPPVSSVTFGEASASEDFAQSFKISSSTNISSISIYIKKYGLPNNITLRIVKDSSGSPSNNDNDVLASASITSSSVTTNYGWVEGLLPSNTNLTENVSYWLVLDTSYNSNNYYTIGTNLDNSYLNGTSKNGRYKNSWTNTSSDSYFKIYIGGSFGKISGESAGGKLRVGTIGTGDAYANNILYTDATGVIKCQVGISNNKNCTTSYPDPSPSILPISDDNITEWKDTATLGGTINGNYYVDDSDRLSLGPKKINGNLTVSNSGVLTLTGTLYVTGNITINGSGEIKLDSNYFGDSGIIVSDGIVQITNSGKANGSGQTGSYLLIATTNSCRGGSSCGGNNAIRISGAGGAVMLNAQKGSLYISGSGEVNEATAYNIVMDGEATLSYESGVIDSNFVSGPSGGFDITGWSELQN